MSFDPDWVISPGETLREWIDENGLTVRSTAITCGRMDPDRLRRIVDGKRRITRDDAARLAAGTGIPARLWLTLERAYRDGLARGKVDTSNVVSSDGGDGATGTASIGAP